MTVLRTMTHTLALSYILVMFSNPAFGVSVTYGTGEVTSSSNYHLDTSTVLVDGGTLGDGMISRNIQVSGSGENAISQSVDGKGYSIKNKGANSGSLNAQSSVTATSNEASYSQSFFGKGETGIQQIASGDNYGIQNTIANTGSLDASASISSLAGAASLAQSISGSGNTGFQVNGADGHVASTQEANTFNGYLSSGQQVLIGSDLSTSQITSMNGAMGEVASTKITPTNCNVVTGSFVGTGDLDTKLSNSVSGRNGISGEIKIDGETWIDDDAMEDVGANCAGFSVDGLRNLGKGFGSFDVAAMSLSPEVFANEYPEMLPDTSNIGANLLVNSPESYKLGIWVENDHQMHKVRWNERNPQISFYLNPQNLDKENLLQENVVSALSSAAGTWDIAVPKQQLFSSNPIRVDTSKAVDVIGDKNNVIGWKQIPGNAIAYEKTWCDMNSQKRGFLSVLESDISFNTNNVWTTDKDIASADHSKIDVESIALHELGHTLGLGEQYYVDSSGVHDLDSAQAMASYSGPKRSLGNGDLKGVRLLYNYDIASLRSFNGKYVTAENGGSDNNADVNANRDWFLGWETFELADLGDKNVVLRSYNGQYVCADGSKGQKLVANRKDPLGWETFKLKDLGDNNIALQAYNGRWVCAENGGGRELVANRDIPLGWETFRLITQEEDLVWRDAKNMKLVSAELGGGGKLVADRDQWYAWEQFDFIQLDPLTHGSNSDTIAIRANSGQYVCAEGGGGKELVANRDSIAGWEIFTREYLGYDAAKGGTRYRLKAFNGQYLRADPNRSYKLYADGSGSDEWGIFNMGYFAK